MHTIATGLKGLSADLIQVCIHIKWLQHELYFHKLFLGMQKKGNHHGLFIAGNFMEKACGIHGCSITKKSN